MFEPDTRQFIGEIHYAQHIHAQLGSVHYWWTRRDQDSEQEWTDFISTYVPGQTWTP